MGRDDQLLRLAELAESHWGMFTTAQAAVSGVRTEYVKRFADRGLIARMRHGVYRMAGAPEGPDSQIRAEWLALEPDRPVGERLRQAMPVGVVSHRSAADIQSLGD